MLDVEQPDADRAREHRRRSPDQQEVSPADQPATGADEHEDGGIGRQHAVAHAGPRAACDDPRADHHRDDRAKPEHHQGATDQSVAQPPPPRAGGIFVDRQRDDVPDAAAVEVTGGGVMHRMVVAPAHERGEDQHAQRGAEHRVGATGRQQRAVRTIVEDHEHAHEEPGREDRQGDRQRKRDAERRVDRARSGRGRGQRRSRWQAGRVADTAWRTARACPHDGGRDESRGHVLRVVGSGKGRPPIAHVTRGRAGRGQASYGRRSAQPGAIVSASHKRRMRGAR